MIKTNAAANGAFKFYQKSILTALIAVLILVYIGAFVRASGSGMGCPDWPTCFGQWVPPTSIEQLPADYQETYADLGYADQPFNALKTWTEYLNRLSGVIVGLLIILQAFAAHKITHPSRKKLLMLSWSSVIAVCFQGWLGSRVVASNLTPGMITLHMLMALIILGLLLTTYFQTQSKLHNPASKRQNRSIKRWAILFMVLSVIQILMGTQVREMIDALSHLTQGSDRSTWASLLPWFFYVHRSFSILVLGLSLYLAYKHVRLFHWRHPITRFSIGVVLSIMGSAATGAALNHLGFPWLIQPLHLVFAALFFCLQLTVMYYILAMNPHDPPPQ